MRQRLLVVFLVALVALVVGAVRFSASRPAADLLCGWLVDRAEEHLDGTLAIGRCEIAPLRARLTFHEVDLALPDAGLTLTIDRAEVRLRDFQGFTDPVRVQWIEVHGPHLALDLDAGAGEGGALPCELPPIPLDLVQATLRDGSVDLRVGGRRLQADGLEADFTRRGDVHALSLEAEAPAWDGEAPEGRVEARLRVDPGAGRVELERIALLGDGASLSARGGIAWACTPRVEATAVATGDVERLLGLLGLSEVPAEGRLSLTARVEGPVDALEAEGSLEATDARFAFSRLGHVEAQGRVADGVLTVRRAVTDAIGGRVVATGTVGLSEGLPLDVSLEAQGGTLEGLVWALGGPRSWAGGGLEGRLDLRGPLVPPDLTGRADLRLTDFTALDRPVGDGRGPPATSFLAIADARVFGELSLGVDGITVPQGAVQLDRSRGRFVGEFPFSLDRPVSVELDVEQAHLAEFGRVADLAFGGVMSGRAVLGGRYADPRIDARVEARGFELDGIEAGVAMARVSYEDLRLALSAAHGQRGHTTYNIDRMVLALGPDPVRLDLEVSTDDGRVEDVVAALRRYHPIAEQLVGAEGRVRGGVRISGPLGRLTTVVDATATEGAVLGQPFRRVRGKLRFFEQHRWELGEVRLALEGGGSLTGRGFADMDGALGLSVSGREVPLEGVAPLMGLPLAGLVSGDVVLQGTWAHPEAHGAVSLTAGRLEEVPLRPARLQVALDGPRLALSGEWSGAAVTGEAWTALDASGAFGLDLRVDEPDLGRWRPLLLAAGLGEEGLEGAVSGRARLEGRTGDPASLVGELALSHLSLRRPGLDVHTTGPARLELAEGWLTTDALELASDGARVSAAGGLALDGRMDLALRGSGDLQLLEGRVPGLQAASGAVTAEATVGGTLEAPLVLGSAELEDGALAVEDLPLSLSRLDGRLAFSQHRVVVERLSGRAGGGRVRFSGEIALDALAAERLDLGARLEEVRVSNGGLDATVSGELKLDGAPADPLLSGRVGVQRARYERDFGLEELLPSIRRNTAEAAVERDPRLRLDVTLGVPGTLVLEGRGVHARLRGELHVLGTDARPGLLGTLSTTEARAELRGNEWEATHAVLDFKDPGRIAPSFDVHAESDVREYRLFVHAYGTPADPRVTLTSDPDLPEVDVLTLVTLGVTTRDAEGLGGGDAAAAAADALFAISGLDRQVREFIPSNDILRDPTLRLTSGYSRFTGQVEPRLSFESRVFVDELRLRYSAPLSTAGQRTQAEYRITDTVSVQAEWDTEESEGTLGNLGLDLKLRWEGE